MTIVYSDTISIATKGFSDAIDIPDRVDKITEDSKVVNGMRQFSARALRAPS